MTQLEKLIAVENKAFQLFDLIEQRGLISAGKTEKELNKEIFDLANEAFGIRKFWHKRIVRAGANTLLPYAENPPVLTIQEDDILFLDFGPIFEEWEADIGKTYVLGNDERKLKLQKDVEESWIEANQFYLNNPAMTGAELFAFVEKLALQKGWDFNAEIAGHIVGHFPHEKLDEMDKSLYVHPDNNKSMAEKDGQGKERSWILEVHFIDKKHQIGSFVERLLR